MYKSLNDQSVAILGTGYVGLTTAALFAATGLRTYVVDINPERLQSVREGKSFFFEEGLDALVSYGIKRKLLIPTHSYEEAVSNSSVIISSVGTPDNQDGSINLSYVFAAATEATKYMKPNAIYVQKSTVPVGTGRQVENIFKDAGMRNKYVSNPEFLRESTALRDSLWFDRIVVGGDSFEAIDRVTAIYRQVEKARDGIARIAGLKNTSSSANSGKYISTSLESAELIKVVSNAFLALKISFANSIAKLADQVNADIVEVMDAVGADKRIGRAFLDAGRGYGGGCFPKDVNGLIAAGLEHEIDLDILKIAQNVNESQPAYVVDKLQQELGSLIGHKVALLGLAFKSGTSDTRKSPSIRIANLLVAKGARVAAFDPQANSEEMLELDSRVSLAKSLGNAIENADAVIVATDWPEFINISPVAFSGLMSGNVFVDAMNRFDMKAVSDAGLRYVGVGRNSPKQYIFDNDRFIPDLKIEPVFA